MSSAETQVHIILEYAYPNDEAEKDRLGVVPASLVTNNVSYYTRPSASLVSLDPG